MLVKNTKETVTEDIMGVEATIYVELEPEFVNACINFYYGEGFADWFKDAEKRMSHEDAKILKHEAFMFMAEERQPDLEILGNISLNQ